MKAPGTPMQVTKVTVAVILKRPGAGYTNPLLPAGASWAVLQCQL
jgi:hypothetical protein